MKARPVFYIPTMDIFEFLADTRGVRGLRPLAIRRAGAGRVCRARRPRGTARSEYADGYRERYPELRERAPAPAGPAREPAAGSTRRACPIALGTDMWAFPGLGRLDRDGPLRARPGSRRSRRSASATQTAARSLGIDGDRGTLEAGKRADFLVLSRDPLRDVRNVRRIVEVYKKGRAARDRARRDEAIRSVRPAVAGLPSARGGAARLPRRRPPSFVRLAGQVVGSADRLGARVDRAGRARARASFSTATSSTGSGPSRRTSRRRSSASSVGLRALVVAGGLVAAAASLAALYSALRRVTGRREAMLWTALAIPALVFMPNAGGAASRDGLSHLACRRLVLAGSRSRLRAGPRRARGWTALVGSRSAGGARRAVPAPSGAAVALGGAALVRLAPAQTARRAAADAFRLAAGFIAVVGAGLGAFVALAGKAAVIDDGHVLLTGLPAETRDIPRRLRRAPRLAERIRPDVLFRGDVARGRAGRGSRRAAEARRPRGEGPAAGRSGPRRHRRARRRLRCGPLLGRAARLCGGARGRARAAGAPGARRIRSPRRAAALAFAAAGLVLAYRRPFHIGDSAYVGPPLLFAFVSAAALLRVAVLCSAGGRSRRRVASAFRLATAGVLPRRLRGARPAVRVG